MMNKEEGMSMREVDRLEVIRDVLGRRLGQREAGERLGICVRQVKRLVRRYAGGEGVDLGAPGPAGEQCHSTGGEERDGGGGTGAV